MVVALVASWFMDTMYRAYESVHPSVDKLFNEQEFVLPLAVLVLVGLSAGMGWSLQTVAAGHRAKLLEKLAGEEGNMKVARKRRLEDAIVNAIEDMIYDKTMSDEQATDWYRKFAVLMSLEGLLIPDGKTRKQFVREYRKLHAYRLAKLKEKTKAGIAALKEAKVIPFPQEVSKPTVVRGVRTKTRQAAA